MESKSVKEQLSKIEIQKKNTKLKELPNKIIKYTTKIDNIKNYPKVTKQKNENKQNEEISENKFKQYGKLYGSLKRFKDYKEKNKNKEIGSEKKNESNNNKDKDEIDSEKKKVNSNNTDKDLNNGKGNNNEEKQEKKKSDEEEKDNHKNDNNKYYFEIHHLPELQLIKNTLKKEFSMVYIPPNIVIVCFKLFVILDTINDEWKEQTIDEELFIKVFSYLIKHNTECGNLIEDGFESIVCYRDFLNSNNITVRSIIQYLLSISLLRVDINNNVVGRTIKSAIFAITEGQKIYLIYSEYILHILCFLYIKTFQNNEESESKSGQNYINIQTMKKILFTGICSLIKESLSQNSYSLLADIFIITYESFSSKSKTDAQGIINKNNYFEKQLKTIERKNKKLYNHIINSILKNSDMDSKVHVMLTEDKEKQQNVITELNLEKNQLSLLLNWNQVQLNLFYKKCYTFYEKIIYPAKLFITKKINEGIMLENNINFITKYILKEGYSEETKYYVLRILNVLHKVQKENRSNKHNKFIFDLISRYQAYFIEEWDLIFEHLIDKDSKDSNNDIIKLYALFAKLKNTNKYKGNSQLINNLCDRWSTFDGITQDYDSYMYYIRLHFSNDILNDKIIVCNKVITQIKEKNNKNMILFKEIIRYIIYYYFKNSDKEIWIKRFEEQLVSVIIKIIKKIIELDIDYNWEEFVLLFFTETKNLQFFEQLLNELLGLEINDLGSLLSNTLMNYGNTAFSIPKLQSVLDKIDEFFRNQNNSFEQNFKQNNIKDLKKILDRLIVYYIDSNSRLYIVKAHLKNKEFTRILVDNVNSKAIKSGNNAIFNLNSTFSLLKTVFESIKEINEDIHFILPKALELLDRHISKSFYFFKNADIIELIEKINNVKGLLEGDYNESNYFLLYLIIHFLSNISFHIQCDYDMPNPYINNKLTDERYNLFKSHTNDDTKKNVQRSLESPFKNIKNNTPESQDSEKKKKSKKKEKEQLINEKKNNSNNRLPNTKYIIYSINSLQFVFYSTYYFEKEEEIQYYNFIQLFTSETQQLRIDNKTFNQIAPVFIDLFSIRNCLSDNDLYLGYTIIHFLYMNKELFCKFDIFILESIILLLSLGWPEKAKVLQEIVDNDLKVINSIEGCKKIKINCNTFCFGHFFNVCCDNIINYFSEQLTTKSKEILLIFNKLFNEPNQSEMKSINDFRSYYMMEMIKWHLSSKSQRDNVPNQDNNPNLIKRIYSDNFKIVTLIHDKTNLNNFDVIIRSPISNSYFTIEKPKEESDGINTEQTYQILNEIVNGEKKAQDNNIIQDSQEKEEIKPEEIEEIIQNNSFLFQRIYKFNARNSMVIPKDPKDNKELMNYIKAIDLIPVYRLYDCTIVCLTENREKNLDFIRFLNSLGDLVSTEEELEKQIVKIHHQDINNSITFRVNNDDQIFNKSTKPLSFSMPDSQKALVFNYVTVIWKEFNTPRIGKQINKPICIVIKPYSKTHYRIKIKLSSNLDEKFKTILNSSIMNNMVIYIGKEYEVLSNYIIKMIVILNSLIYSIITQENEKNMNSFLDYGLLDNVYKRYHLLSELSLTEVNDYLIVDKNKIDVSNNII